MSTIRPSRIYPCNYYIQSINDAVLQLAPGGDLKLDAIEGIVVNTVQAAMALVCEPIEQKRRPKVMIDAQFSVPFNIALALVKKRISSSVSCRRPSPPPRSCA